ncbi:type 1 glycerol-3-phosphate oxidase [Lapidilactobacillus achengensis]|uniref:Alpha-glycerophosphate oxidase n=1 Tax=Lapidilactobacillus achengensis TaxID=2486000 RepID=A0ABW1UKF1_9LACO|nr:type 1 glycerol-3-phosphate oxidase [Lapidilactobacillus achengensis]
MTFSAQTRQDNLKRLANETFDLVIIGGGITGAGVALQAAASGLKTALLEMQDFAEGTSSRSTKMVHGGIRYLKNFDVGVVADTVQERAKVQQIAPHIPQPIRMLLPIYNEPDATYDMFAVKVAMKLYDQLAMIHDPRLTSFTLTRDEVITQVPELNPENLLGAGSYLDFTNNDARLVIENIKKAAAFGGVMVSRTKVTNFLHDEQGHVCGVTADDLLSDNSFAVHSRLVLNAAGPWVDQIDQLDEQVPYLKQLRPTKGIHVVVDWHRLPVPQPLYFDSRHHDERMIFVIPRAGKTYFGTTDTDYRGDLRHPQITQDDLDYLLTIVNQRFPEAKITLADIEASWAGIRPLIASNGSSDYNGGGGSHITDQSVDEVIGSVNNYNQGRATRDDIADAVMASEQTLSEKILKPSQISRGSSLHMADDGLIILSGGKITDYRRMAAGALEMILREMKTRFHQQFQPIDSTKLRVSGGDINPSNVQPELQLISDQGEALGLAAEDARKIAHLFGSNALQIFTMIHTTQPAAGLSLAETLMLNYCLREEMVLTPVDYLLRRTNHILFEADSLAPLKQPIIDEMARQLNWNPHQTQRMTQQLDQVLRESNLTYLKAGQSHATLG